MLVLQLSCFGISTSPCSKATDEFGQGCHCTFWAKRERKRVFPDITFALHQAEQIIVVSSFCQILKGEEEPLAAELKELHATQTLLKELTVLES